MTSLDAPVSLSRQRIMRAALDIVDADGLESLTMRRLGQAVGREAMALYRYTPNRNAILDGVIALAMEEMVIEPQERWQDQLRAGAHAFRDMILRHPHVLPLMATRPLNSPLAHRPTGLVVPIERLLELFRLIGFGPQAAVQTYRLYSGLLLGHMVNELQLYVIPPKADALEGGELELSQLELSGLDAWSERDFPLVREHADFLFHFDGGQELDRAMTILIAGLESELDRGPGGSPPTT